MRGPFTSAAFYFRTGLALLCCCCVALIVPILARDPLPTGAVNGRPWMALVDVGGLDCYVGRECSGVVLTRRHVMTAAACLTYNVRKCPGADWGKVLAQQTDFYLPINAFSVSVRPGIGNTYGRHAAKWTQSSPFNTSILHLSDIAIIELTDPLNYSSQLQPIRLSARQVPPTAQLSLVSLGYKHTQLHAPTDEFGQMEMIYLSRTDTVGEHNVTIIAQEACLAEIHKAGFIKFDENTTGGVQCTSRYARPSGAKAEAGSSLFYIGNGTEPVLIGLTTMSSPNEPQFIGLATMPSPNDPLFIDGAGTAASADISVRSDLFIPIAPHCDFIESATGGMATCYE